MLPNLALLDQAAPLRGAGPGVSAAARPWEARAAHAGPKACDSLDPHSSFATRTGQRSRATRSPIGLSPQRPGARLAAPRLVLTAAVDGRRMTALVVASARGGAEARAQKPYPVTLTILSMSMSTGPVRASKEA